MTHKPFAHPLTLSTLVDACVRVCALLLTLSTLMDACGQTKTQHNDTLSGHTEAAHGYNRITTHS